MPAFFVRIYWSSTADVSNRYKNLARSESALRAQLRHASRTQGPGDSPPQGHLLFNVRSLWVVTWPTLLSKSADPKISGCPPESTKIAFDIRNAQIVALQWVRSEVLYLGDLV